VLKEEDISMGYRHALVAYCLILLNFPLAESPAASQQKVRIAYSSISGNTLALWIPLDQGLFKKYGVEVEAVYISGEPMLTQAVTSGDIAVAQQGAVGAIRGANAGLDLTILLGVINKFNYSLVTRPDIQRVEDFRGRKMGVGGGFGGPPAFATRWVLRRFGLQPDRDVATLVIRGSGQPERLAALRAGTIDGILLSAPATLLARKAGLRILVELANLEAEFPHTVFTTTRRFLKREPALAEGIVKGIVEGIALAKTRKDIAMKSIAKWLRVSDPEVMEEVYREVAEKSLSEKPYPTIGGIQLLLNELASQEPRFSNARPEDFIETSVLRALDKSGFIDSLYR
jgi:NitT/TauT family transport system substrate-binding protein